MLLNGGACSMFIREITEMEHHPGLNTFQTSNGSAQSSRYAKTETLEHLSRDPFECW